MLITARAIVLQRINYSDTSIISRLLTDSHGVVSCFHPGARSRKAKARASLFLPLQSLEVTARFHNDDKLIKPREIRLAKARQYLHTEPIHNCIAFFLAELVNRSLQEAQPDEQLFAFVSQAVDELDTEMSANQLALFPVSFMLSLTRWLGFFPSLEPGNYFDLSEGSFTTTDSERIVENRAVSGLWRRLLQPDNANPAFTKTERLELLESLQRYYQAHLGSFGYLKSLEVLSDVLK